MPLVPPGTFEVRVGKKPGIAEKIDRKAASRKTPKIAGTSCAHNLPLMSSLRMSVVPRPNTIFEYRSACVPIPDNGLPCMGTNS